MIEEVNVCIHVVARLSTIAECHLVTHSSDQYFNRKRYHQKLHSIVCHCQKDIHWQHLLYRQVTVGFTWRIAQSTSTDPRRASPQDLPIYNSWLAGVLCTQNRPGTYTLAWIILSTNSCSPSATWMTSSMRPAPIFCSSSWIL